MATKTTPNPSQEDYDKKFNEIVDGINQSKEEVDDLEKAFNAPAYGEDNQNDDQISTDKQGYENQIGYKPDDLEKMEQDAVSQDEPDSGAEISYKSGDRKRTFRDVFTRKRAIILGGSSGAGLLFGASVILAPPLQLIHAANLLTGFHFGTNQDVTESRVTRLWRFMRDPTNPQNRRLSELGKKYVGRIDDRMRLGGVEVDFSRTGNFNQITIDPAFAEKTQREIIADLEKRGATGARVVDGKVQYDITGYQPRTRLRLNKYALNLAGYSGKFHTTQSRVLKKRAGVIFGPIRYLDNKIKEGVIDAASNQREKYREWKESRAETLETGKAPADVDIKAGSTEDADGNSSTDARDTAAADDGNNKLKTDPDAPGSARSSKVKTSLKAGGSIALIGQLGCLMLSVQEQADSLIYANVQQPIIRAGMEVVKVGNQLMAGVDVDLEELSFLSDLMSTDFFAARGIQHELGQELTGPDIPASVVLNPQSAFFTEIVESIPGIRQFCSASGSFWGQIVLTGIDVISGPVSAIGATVLTEIYADDVIDAAAQWIADDPIDLAEIAGADFGSIANLGVYLAAGEQSLLNGGRPLTSPEIGEYREAHAEDRRIAASEKSVWQRMFAKEDPYSFVSVASRKVPNNFKNVASSIISSPFGIVSSIKSMFVGGQVYAGDDPSTYEYPTPPIGFSIDELNDPRFENPFQNMEAIQRDIQEAHDDWGVNCFSVRIDESNDTVETLPGKSYSQLEKDCPELFSSSQSEDFIRYRFYILDYMTMLSIVCYEGDEKACGDLGATSQSAESLSVIGDTLGLEPGESSEGSTEIIGNPYSSSQNVPCHPETIDLGVTSDSYSSGRQVNMRLCALPNLPSSGEESTPGNPYYVAGANGLAIVNSRVSGAWWKLVEDASADGIDLSAVYSYRTNAHQEALCNSDPDCSRGVFRAVAPPGGSSHQSGVALDFDGMGYGSLEDVDYSATCSNRDTANTAEYRWMNQEVYAYGFKQYAKESWHFDAFTADSRCTSPGQV